MAKLLSNTRIYGTGTVDTQLFVQGFRTVHSTASGSLQVSGGIGVSGGGFFGGTVTATNFVGAISGTASLATDLAGGTAGQLVYQISPNDSGFVGPGTAGQILVSAGTSAPVYTNTSTFAVGLTANLLGGTANQFAYQTAANSTAFISTGSMYVGRSALADNLVSGSINTSTNLLGGTAGQVPYQTAPGATSFFGPGTVGQILVSNGTSGPTYTNTSSIYVNSAVNAQNIFGGTAGQLHYQSSAGVTAFAGPGTSGQILVSAGTAAPVYTSTSSIYVNRAVLADNDAGGAAGGLRYQTGINASTFLSIGTAGQMLRVNAGASAPEWVNTSSIYVNRAVLADSATSASAASAATNISGGTAGQVPYQTGAGATSFFGPGSVGQILVSNGTSAPTYTNTSSIYVNSAVNAQNIFGGTAGQIVYQSSGGTTSFAGPGTAGQILTSNGTSAPVYVSTTTLYVNRAVLADNVTGNAGSISTVGQTANATYFLTFVDANNSSPSAELLYTSSTFVINPSTGAVSVGTSTSLGKFTVSDPGATTLTLERVSNDSGPPEAIGRKSRGTIGAKTGVQSGDRLWFFAAAGYVGTEGVDGAYSANRVGMNFVASETWTSTAQGSHITFATTQAGTTTRTDKVIITGAGDVGIGTVSPSAKLHIVTGSNKSILTKDASHTTLTTDLGSAITFSRPSDGSNDLSGIFSWNNGGLVLSSRNEIIFATGGTSTYSNTFETMRITRSDSSAGNVGIGTTSPGFRLDVAGTARATSDFRAPIFYDSNDTTYYMDPASTSIVNTLISGTATPTGSTIGGIRSYGSTSAYISASDAAGRTAFFGVDSSNYSMFGSLTNHDAVIRANNTEYLRVHTAGYTTISGSARSPIFYDSDNTSFYTDPASNSVLNTLTTNGINCQDTRATATTPQTYNNVVRWDFKSNTTNGLSDGGNYNGVMYWRRYGSGSDWTGGGAIELAYSDNARLWMRYGSSTSWGSWKRVLFGDNFDNGGSVQVTSLGVGTAASGTTGEIRATNEITAYYSDRRLKENVESISNALEKVRSLHGIKYNANDVAVKFGYSKDKKIVGLFADEVESVLPEAVRLAPFDIGENGESKSGENYKTIQYEKLVPLLIEAIKEQSEKIDNLEKEIINLKNQFSTHK